MIGLLPSLLVSAGAAVMLAGIGKGLSRGLIPPLHPRCLKCNSRIPERLRTIARFCPFCGAELVRGGYCPECKLSYGPGIRYCPIHGIELGEKEEKKAPEAEIELSDRILKVVKEHAGVTLSEIAESLGMPYQRLTLIVKDLIKQGKIKKRNRKYFAK